VLARALSLASELIEGGERSPASVRDQVLPLFARYPQARVEYFEIVDPATITPVVRIRDSVLIAGAMWLGSTRLIDNVVWRGNKKTA
jgi:pantoate--beta-alanine ligase